MDDLGRDVLVRVHPGDPHIAAERERADAVFGLAAAELDEQRAHEQREALDAHADRLGGREVARLVQDDQRDKAQEGQDVGHRFQCGRRFCGVRKNAIRSRYAERPLGHELAGDPARLGVGLPERLERVDRLRRKLLERLLDHVGDIQEPQAPAEERVHGDLVGGVHRARRGAAGARGVAGDAHAAERLLVDGLERQAAELDQVERPDGDVDALGVVQRVGDRHAHVRVAEMRERGAVAQLDQAVDDRLRVHDDVDLLVRRAEQVVGLDQLEPLVHQRRRVDRDLAAHRPRRVGERLLDRDVLEVLALEAAERAARGGQDQAVDGARGARRRAAGAAPNARSRPG